MVIARCGECGDVFNAGQEDVFEVNSTASEPTRLVAFCKPCQKAARQAC
jgi:ribosomal 30S subunit maturation factor RimM